MEVKYNVTGIKRKNLVREIAKWLCFEVMYLGVPSCADEIGACKIDLNGNLTINTKSDNMVIKPLLKHLKAEGYERIDTNQPEIADSELKME